LDRPAVRVARNLPRHEALPLRPLTIGELLDAAVQLVRAQGIALLAVAAVFALAEQAVLFPLRASLGVNLAESMPDLLGPYWFVLALGFGLEALIVTALGLLAGRVAVADVTDTPLATRDLLRPRWPTIGAICVVAPVAALLAGIGALLGPVWLVGYALFGLAGAVIAIEGGGALRALGRATALTGRGTMRGTGVRVLGYLSWLTLRFGFFLGMTYAIDFLGIPPDVGQWVLIAALTVANAVAYANLAGLDAVVLIEARIRTEGLDLWLGRAAQHHELTADALLVRR
jgi:hypothetical protein